MSDVPPEEYELNYYAETHGPLNDEAANKSAVFQRLHAKSVYPGTGMGLAIARKIVETMDGDIWVSAEEGKGSRFYFTIKKEI